MSQNNTNKKWVLMLCELHYPGIHGKTVDSDLNIETHYLVYDRFDSKTGISYQDLDEYEEYDTDDDNSDDEDNSNGLIKINDSMNHLNNYYSNITNIDPAIFGNHPTIRNYHNIVSRPNYIQPEIGEYIILPTFEAVAILKTFWLRIIQRTWKNIYKKRKTVIQRRSNPCSIFTRETNGKWPQNCLRLPGLKGMLSGLK